jgi:hypothetical protein
MWIDIFIFYIMMNGVILNWFPNLGNYKLLFEGQTHTCPVFPKIHEEVMYPHLTKYILAKTNC